MLLFTAADGAVRLLPQLAQMRQRQPALIAGAPKDAASELAAAAIETWTASLLLLQRRLSGAVIAAELAEAASAARQLHATTCSLLRWAAATPAAEQQLLLPILGDSARLEQLAFVSIDNARVLQMLAMKHPSNDVEYVKMCRCAREVCMHAASLLPARFL